MIMRKMMCFWLAYLDTWIGNFIIIPNKIDSFIVAFSCDPFRLNSSQFLCPMAYSHTHTATDTNAKPNEPTGQQQQQQQHRFKQWSFGEKNGDRFVFVVVFILLSCVIFCCSLCDHFIFSSSSLCEKPQKDCFTKLHILKPKMMRFTNQPTNYTFVQSLHHIFRIN